MMYLICLLICGYFLPEIFALFATVLFAGPIMWLLACVFFGWCLCGLLRISFGILKILIYGAIFLFLLKLVGVWVLILVIGLFLFR